MMWLNASNIDLGFRFGLIQVIHWKTFAKSCSWSQYIHYNKSNVPDRRYITRRVTFRLAGEVEFQKSTSLRTLVSFNIFYQEMLSLLTGDSLALCGAIPAFTRGQVVESTHKLATKCSAVCQCLQTLSATSKTVSQKRNYFCSHVFCALNTLCDCSVSLIFVIRIHTSSY